MKEAANLIESVPVYEYLDEKKPLIEKHEFLPTVDNIIQELPDFRNVRNLSALIYTWLKNNNLPSITRLKELTNQESIRRKLHNILDPLKKEIENFEFPPTVENIREISDEFDDFDDLPIYISRWLNENNITPNLTEYLHNIGIMSDSRRLKDFLDLKYPDIANGDYFATIKNLRQDQDQIGIDIDSMTTLNMIRAEWHNKNFGKSMTQLIDEFDPSYDQLGYDIQWHGYPAQFRSDKLRVMNAEFQVYMLVNQTELKGFNAPQKFNSLESLLKYLRTNLRWKFVDILTGEIFTLKDLYKGNIILHHLNFQKEDLSPDNLVYIFRNTHGLINAAERYDKELLEFFTTLLILNINSLKEYMIPSSWLIGWRNIALENGIELPANRYFKKRKRATIIKHSKKYRNLDQF